MSGSSSSARGASEIVFLGVNIDYIATLRQARGTSAMPGPDEAAGRVLSVLPQLRRYPSGSFVDIREILDPDEAAARLGIEQHRSGYWFPLSGWLNPPAVCSALLAHDLMDAGGQRDGE